MAAKKCPRCKYANDFHVNESFEVSCGYCGYTVARIKAQFQQAKSDCVVSERARKLRVTEK
ncbi:hypothetical protein NI385_16350 [Vibrio parahaemolyticus]|nr:hypothetical protein D050_4054 [Vibrio parahaemolyticus VPCR-2009]WMN77615.1 hypothetical protein NI385_16350 [Vibrio parahaemolyticus]